MTLPADTRLGRYKIVINVGNYYPQRDEQIRELDSGETTSSEMMSAHSHGARLVKGFNTIYYAYLGNHGERRLLIFRLIGITPGTPRFILMIMSQPG